MSGDDNLFREIIAPVDQEAREKDAAFKRAYAAKINELTADFSLNFLSGGQIDWLKLVEFVSARAAPKITPSAAGEQSSKQIRDSAQQIAS